MVTFFTPHLAQRARHAGVHIGLVLKEVEMASGHLFGVVDRAIGSAAGRTGEATGGGEVDVDVEPAGRGIEVAAGDRPGWHNILGQLQQAGVAHGAPSVVARACLSVAPCAAPRGDQAGPEKRRLIELRNFG